MSDKTQVDELSYAEDVLRASEYVGRPLTRSKAKTSRCKKIHEWASNPENLDKFLSIIVPKSVDVLQRSRKNQDPDQVPEAERKSILELKAFLRDEIDRSQSPQSPVEATQPKKVSEDVQTP